MNSKICQCILFVSFFIAADSGPTTENFTLLKYKSRIAKARNLVLNVGLDKCIDRYGKRTCETVLLLEMVDLLNRKRITKRKTKTENTKKGCWVWNISTDISQTDKSNTTEQFYFDKDATNCFDDFFKNHEEE